MVQDKDLTTASLHLKHSEYELEYWKSSGNLEWMERSIKSLQEAAKIISLSLNSSVITPGPVRKLYESHGVSPDLLIQQAMGPIEEFFNWTKGTDAHLELIPIGFTMYKLTLTWHSDSGVEKVGGPG